MRAVHEYGSPLVDDPARLAGVEAVPGWTRHAPFLGPRTPPTRGSS